MLSCCKASGAAERRRSAARHHRLRWWWCWWRWFLIVERWYSINHKFYGSPWSSLGFILFVAAVAPINNISAVDLLSGNNSGVVTGCWASYWHGSRQRWVLGGVLWLGPIMWQSAYFHTLECKVCTACRPLLWPCYYRYWPRTRKMAIANKTCVSEKKPRAEDYVVEAFNLYAKLIFGRPLYASILCLHERREIIITKGGYLTTHLHKCCQNIRSYIRFTYLFPRCMCVSM